MSKKKIIICILICIILIVLLTLLINNEKRSKKQGLMDGVEVEGQLLFSGLSVFSESYKGDFESKEITKEIQELVKKDIPELYKDIRKLNDKEVKKYYSENQISIKDKFGIQSEEEFIDLSNKIKQTKINLNTWEKVKVKKSSFLSESDKTNYVYFEFDVIFENEETITYTLYVANRILMSPQFIFGIK